MSPTDECASEAGRAALEASALEEAAQAFTANPAQWLIFCDPASLALRNIDHLFPGSPATTTIDAGSQLLLLRTSGKSENRNGNTRYETGMFAVRGTPARAMAANWQSARSLETDEARRDRWKDVVDESELVKAPFEDGETIAPLSGR